MDLQCAPDASHRNHWDAYEIVPEPDHEPVAPVSCLPALADPAHARRCRARRSRGGRDRARRGAEGLLRSVTERRSDDHHEDRPEVVGRGHVGGCCRPGDRAAKPTVPVTALPLVRDGRRRLAPATGRGEERLALGRRSDDRRLAVRNDRGAGGGYGPDEPGVGRCRPGRVGGADGKPERVPDVHGHRGIGDRGCPVDRLAVGTRGVAAVPLVART